jgi:hypothetical protein
MKHLSSILLLLVLLLLTRISYGQEENRWKMITTDKNYFIYIDTKTIENKDSVVHCWLKKIPTKKESLNDKDIKYILKNCLFFCGEKKFKFFESYTYFKDNSYTLDTTAFNVNTLIPESVEEILFYSVCK